MPNCPISSGQVLKCKLLSSLNVQRFLKSPFFPNRPWNFSNGPYFEYRAPIFTIFSRPNYSAKKKKKLAGDVLGHRPTTGNFFKKIGDLSAHTICRFRVDAPQNESCLLWCRLRNLNGQCPLADLLRERSLNRNLLSLKSQVPRSPAVKTKLEVLVDQCNLVIHHQQVCDDQVRLARLKS